jgi:hypothetical protein
MVLETWIARVLHSYRPALTRNSSAQADVVPVGPDGRQVERLAAGAGAARISQLALAAGEPSGCIQPASGIGNAQGLRKEHVIGRPAGLGAAGSAQPPAARPRLVRRGAGPDAARRRLPDPHARARVPGGAGRCGPGAGRERHPVIRPPPHRVQRDHRPLGRDAAAARGARPLPGLARPGADRRARAPHRTPPRCTSAAGWTPNAPPGSPPGVRWFDVDIPAVIDLFPGSTTRPSRLARRRWPAAPRRSELAADAAWLLADFCPRWWSASSRLSAS